MRFVSKRCGSRAGVPLLIGACALLAGCGGGEGASTPTEGTTPFSEGAPSAVGLAGGNGWVASAGEDPALWHTVDGREFSRTTGLGGLVVRTMLGFNDDIVLSGVLCDTMVDARCPNGGTSVLRSFNAEGNESWTVELGATESDSIGGARLAGVVGNQMVVETDDSVDWIGPDGTIERTLPSPSAPVCVLNDGPVALRTSGAGQAPVAGTPVTAVANGKPSEVEFQLLQPQGDQWVDLPGGSTKVSGSAPFGGCSNGSAEIEGDVVTHQPTLRWDDSGQRWNQLKVGSTISDASKEVEASATGSGNRYALDIGTGDVLRRSANSLDMTTTAVRFDEVRDQPPLEVFLVVADGDGGLFACVTASRTSCQLVDAGEGGA
jgi:hypothetical protein